jgi:hypothetical protein
LLYDSQNLPDATTIEAAGDVLHLILALRADAALDWFKNHTYHEKYHEICEFNVH